MHLRSGVDFRGSLTAESSSGDAHLQHAIEREVRGGQERAITALHLSKLLPPGPRPHHRRIARAILEDAAQINGGQVFTRSNADVVLICDPAGAFRVRDTLTRLFRADAPVSETLLSLWTLPQDSIALEGYLSRSVTPAAPIEDPNVGSGAIGLIEGVVGSARLTDLIRRQMAVQITPAGMRPLFRELTFSMDALDARTNGTGSAQADSYLFRHLAGRLDLRMINLLAQGLGRPGGLPASPTLHLNLTVRAILSPGFLRLVEAADAAAAKLGIEVAMVDACADPLAFGAARMVLRAHNAALVLDTIGHQAMLISRPEALEPELVKLDWAPRMAKLAPRERKLLAAAIQRTGVRRIVLHRAESQDAITWGVEHGISRFQGRHIDAMLAAGRLADCTHASACTLRQCLERGAATGSSGRTGCQDTTRLDSSATTYAIPA